MEFVGCGLNELSILEEEEDEEEEGGNKSRMGGRKRPMVNNGEDSCFKSKNLKAERKRRKKLSDRLLALRSLVPIITNMNKGTIVEDAITFIDKLKNEVEMLSNQLLDMEAEFSQEAAEIVKKEEAHDAAKEMKKWGIEADVKVTSFGGNKVWIKIIFEKKRGSFTRLMESLGSLGFELTDTSLTSSKGAILVSSCLEGDFGVEQTRELLLEIIKGI